MAVEEVVPHIYYRTHQPYQLEIGAEMPQEIHVSREKCSAYTWC